MRCVRSERACLLAVFLATGCASSDAPTIVVVGFRGEPGLDEPGRVMVSDDGETFSLPDPVGGGEWLTEVARAGDRFFAIGLSGGLWESDSSGRRWEGRALHDTWLDAVHAPDAVPGVVFTAGLGAHWRSDDGGATWLERPVPGLYFEDFAFLDGATGVGVEGTIVPAAGMLWRTEDGGESWVAAAATATALRTLGDAGGGELWAAGDAGLVLSSTDGGVTWSDRSGPRRVGEAPSDFSDLDFAPDGGGWLVGTGGAARMHRGSEHPLEHRWTGGRAGDFVLQGVHAVSRDEAWVCGYVTYTNHGVVLRTRDGGRHWRVMAESPGVFWYSIAGTDRE